MNEYIKMNDALIYNYQKDIIDEKDKEIERLNNQLDFIKDQNKYIDKLEKMVKERNSIIKEAKEYIKTLECESEETYDISEFARYELLNILDKEGDSNE